MRQAISPRLAIRIRLNIPPHPPTRPVEPFGFAAKGGKCQFDIRNSTSQEDGRTLN
jgi:hypothetical protein